VFTPFQLEPAINILKRAKVQEVISSVNPEKFVAQIVLFLKLGKPLNELKSYLPINILPIVSKVFEKLLLKRLLPMVENNRITLNHQFGFRQRHYTLEQTHQIVQKINEALENKHQCSSAFLDSSQAFDKVWHTGLLYKLRLSLPLNYFLIIKFYLDSRHFLVKVETGTQNCPE
jgi:hypothetical protein